MPSFPTPELWLRKLYLLKEQCERVNAVCVCRGWGKGGDLDFIKIIQPISKLIEQEALARLM